MATYASTSSTSPGVEFAAQLLTHPGVIELVLPFFEAIATKIAEKVADRLDEHHHDSINPSEVITAAHAMEVLRIKSLSTLRKNYVLTGRLRVAPPPPQGDRRALYLFKADFQELIRPMTAANTITRAA